MYKRQQVHKVSKVNKESKAKPVLQVLGDSKVNRVSKANAVLTAMTSVAQSTVTFKSTAGSS